MATRRDFLCTMGLLMASPLMLCRGSRCMLSGESRWRKGPWTQFPPGNRERAWRQTFRGLGESQLHSLLGSTNKLNQTTYEGAPARTLLFVAFGWDADSRTLEVYLQQRSAEWRVRILVPTAGGGLLHTDEFVIYPDVEFRKLFPERRA